MNRLKYTNKGFTLIEMIIYIALFSFLIGGGVATMFYIMDSSATNKYDINVQAEGNFISRKIEWALEGASAATVSGSTLTVTNAASAVNPLVFSLQGANVQLVRGAPPTSTATLNSSAVRLTGLTFTDSGGTPKKITATFTIARADGGGIKTFTLSKYLRQ